MSGFGAPGGRAANYKPSPPERGSFPLDHDSECKHLISNYLRCLKKQNTPGMNADECRKLARGYLDCRMEKGLMAKDEWRNLGFGEEIESGSADVLLVGKDGQRNDDGNAHRKHVGK
ncbi:hypothetical protein BT93_L0644 [Corymbia citriodora subsp. variegata]|uniref:Cytochrome c oxidase assembly protein COX19 n=1 Tax=Corymbia citriodora subsp. variegata TaxID=360336 RepID=A0A8T0CGF6_CORYI|nr:hypothetical protein BT93_L0644 [Corymbia citriodora subsp. variegata]